MGCGTARSYKTQRLDLKIFNFPFIALKLYDCPQLLMTQSGDCNIVVIFFSFRKTMLISTTIFSHVIISPTCLWNLLYCRSNFYECFPPNKPRHTIGTCDGGSQTWQLWNIIVKFPPLCFVVLASLEKKNYYVQETISINLNNQKGAQFCRQQ